MITASNDDSERSAPRHVSTEEWSALLRYLDPNPQAAAQKYEAIRSRVVRLLRWRGASAPEELADVAFDRVAKRVLAEGDGVGTDPVAFIVGVARYVALEDVRRGKATVPFEEGDGVPEVPRTNTADVEQAHAALEHCLGLLGAEQQKVVLEYYAGRGRTRIDARSGLAAHARVSDGALRVRLHRLRAKLEECVGRRLGSEDAGARPRSPRETSLSGAPS